MHGEPHHTDCDTLRSAQLYPAEHVVAQFARLDFAEGRSCLAARASIPRVLQSSVRRNRGEAIGRIQRLIGIPERFFYTGKPPTVLGGSYPLLVFMRPLLKS
jgi:hypothetical protein